MSLANLLARIDAGEFDREKQRPATSATSAVSGDVSAEMASPLGCTSATFATSQNDNLQSEPGPSAPVTVTEPGASNWRLPDGREVWTSPPETLEQIQARHPGAVPWTDADTVTVTELPPEDAAKIRAWLVSLGEPMTAIEQDMRTARRFPDTAAWLLARAHIDVTARATLHTCGDCQCFTHDPEGGGGIGTCAITKAGHPPKDATGYPLCYPFMQRRCPDFVASEPLQ
jgi:hypothetical protein